MASGTTSTGRDASIGVAISRSAGDDLEPGGRIEPAPESRLRDEGVEHAGAR